MTRKHKRRPCRLTRTDAAILDAVAGRLARKARAEGKADYRAVNASYWASIKAHH